MKIDRYLEPDGRWKFSLSLKDAEDISRLWVRGYTLRIGRARLRMAGIGTVGTDEPYRNRGYSRAVIEDSLRFMVTGSRGDGFDVSMLFGIPNFYSKFGYVTVLPETWLSFDAASVLSDRMPYTIRDYCDSDADAVKQLYAANNMDRAGTILRDATLWNGFNRGSGFAVVSDETADGTYWSEFAHGIRSHVPADSYVVTDKADNVIGYFVCDKRDEICQLCDIGFANPDIFGAVTSFLANRARHRNIDKVKCSVPADHEFAIFCRRYGCHVETYYPQDHSGMMRIINQHHMFRCLQEELEKRLHESAKFCWWDGKILFSTNMHVSCLDINRSDIIVTSTNMAANTRGTDLCRLQLPQTALTELVMGRRTIDDLLIDADNVTLSDDSYLPVLRTLFPPLHSHMWWTDRF